jgi:hypothetical protein
MLVRRVMNLPGWAPQPGGSTKPGDFFPTSTDDVTIESVISFTNGHLMFTCRFTGASVFYDFAMLEEKTATRLAAILRDHVGQKLTSIAFVEIPTDEA